jgi:hypothetical protein
MRKLLLTILAAGTFATTAHAGTQPASTVTVVDDESLADSTHIYLSQADSTDAGMTKMTYDENPKAFAQGWRDGWNWASKQSDLSPDKPAERMEKKSYGEIDEEPGQTKAIAFFDAMVVWRHRGENQQVAATGSEPKASAWNGVAGGHVTEDAIKENLNDPGSYQLDTPRQR